MATHASPTMGGIETMPISALPETDRSPAIPDIPSLPAAFSTGSVVPPLFDISNNDFYTPSDVEILDQIEEVTNEVLWSGLVFPNVRAVHEEAQSKIGKRFRFKVCLIGSALLCMNAEKTVDIKNKTEQQSDRIPEHQHCVHAHWGCGCLYKLNMSFVDSKNRKIEKRVKNNKGQRASLPCMQAFNTAVGAAPQKGGHFLHLKPPCSRSR